MKPPIPPRDFRYMVECKDCRLCESRRNVVVGHGPIKQVTYMFIGEAPGENEDAKGLPFVGKAGEKLDELSDQAGFDLDGVYVTNIVKCRPPGNRRPTGHETKMCQKHLIVQIKKIKPDMLVCLGNTSLQYFFPKARIMSVHGTILRTKKGLKIYPIIHPAAALRNPAYEELIVADLSRLNELDLTDKIEFGPMHMEEE